MGKKSELDILREKYGFNKGSYKYIPAGGVLQKFIGQLVIVVEYNKVEEKRDPETPVEFDEEGNEIMPYRWDTKFQEAVLTGMKNFDPMTMTYDLSYRLKDDKEGDPDRVEKIISEGYSFGNPEETGKFLRFMPYSMHCQLVEDELFQQRLKELYEKKDSLDIEDLKVISSSKEQQAILRYAHNISAVIKSDETGEFLCIRLHAIKLTHRSGTTYSLRFENEERHWSMLIDSTEKEYKFENLGTVKILDLAD